MAREPKTQRTIATIRARDVGDKLGIDRTTLYNHIRKLKIQPRFGARRAAFLNPAQAQAVIESVEAVRRAREPSTVPNSLEGERAATLLSSLREGKTPTDLVIEHKATPSEAEGIWKWWLAQTRGLYLTREDLAKLSSMLDGSIIVDAKALLGLVHLRGCCRECETPSLYCANCLPFRRTNGAHAPSPMPAASIPPPPVENRLAADEAAFQAKRNEARKRAGLPPLAEEKPLAHEDP